MTSMAALTEQPGPSRVTEPERPRILMLAYACAPERGSEPGTGWNHAVEAASQFETWVICEQHDCQEAVTGYLERHGDIEGLHFVFLAETRLERTLGSIPGISYVGYNLWNRRAAALARRLHETHRFALVHQVTFTGFREPGYLWQLGIPFVWGPLGGAQNYPWRFLAAAGFVPAVCETLRSVINQFQLHCSFRVGRAATCAAVLLAATTTNQRAIARAHRVAPVTFPDTGVRRIAAPRPPAGHEGPLRILWCGLLIPRKALHLLIEALTQLPPNVPWELRVVGTGPCEAEWRRLAARRGVDHRIRWLGSVPHREALVQFDWADIFAFTSLRDTTGTVLVEALAAGLPIVCLDHQGGADVVDETCGVKIEVTHPRKVIADLAEAITRLSREPETRDTLGRGALRRAEHYLWSEQGKRMADLYRQVLSETAEVPSGVAPAIAAAGSVTNEISGADTYVAGPVLPGPATPAASVSLAAHGAADRTLPARLGRLWQRNGRSSILALFDQAVVSAVRFATTVLIGHFCGAAELGSYALIFSLMLAVQNVLDSMILGPFIVYGSRLSGDRKARYCGSVMLQGVLVAGVAATVFAGASLVLLRWSGGSTLGTALGVLAAAIPFIMLHQFGRRFAFADLDLRSAIALDAAAALIQLAGFAVLVVGGELSATAVFGLAGVAAAVPSLAWLYRNRRVFGFRRAEIRTDSRRNWRLGRWMLASQLASTLGTYAGTWLLAIFLDVRLAGVYAACASIVCLTNPVLLGLGNVLAPRAARAFAEGGTAGLRRVSRESAFLMVGLTGAVALVIGLFGSEALAVLYGPAYASSQAVVILLSVTTMFTAVALVADQGLTALERSDLGLAGQVLGVASTCLVGWLAIPRWGIVGAACGPLLGSLLAAIFLVTCHEFLTHPGQGMGGTA
ncbi:MAG: glycosyltransferase [Thermoguttaceae bacterium]